MGRGRVAFAYFSQFLSVSDHPVTRISLFLRLSSSKFFIETKNIFLFDKKKEGGEKVEKWTVLQVSPSFPSLPSREPRRKNGGQVIGVNHGIGIGIICFCFFPPPPPPLFVHPIRSFVYLFIYFFFLKSRVKLERRKRRRRKEEEERRKRKRWFGGSTCRRKKEAKEPGKVSRSVRDRESAGR